MVVNICLSMRNMSEEAVKAYAYVKASSYRVEVVKILKNREFETPWAISRDTGINLRHVSKVLRELKDSGVAVCINENARKGRLYKLTDLGNEFIKFIN